MLLRLPGAGYVRAAISAQRNDALGSAHLIRTGWFRQAYIKSQSCYRTKLPLTHRRNGKRPGERHTALAEVVRLRCFRSGGVRRSGGRSASNELMDAMLSARAALLKQYCRLHETCRRFIAIIGVGPVTALSFMMAIGDPSRFRRSRAVAAYFGLTWRRWQSGSTIDVQDRISKAADADVRRALYEAPSGSDDALRGLRQGQELGPGDR